ncbi:heavy metal-binding domain-containing protein [Vibrio jasicida]
MRKQAANKKCNAIVGVSIDVDEVSGGGKSMFMVTAVGTAVIVEKRA